MLIRLVNVLFWVCFVFFVMTEALMVYGLRHSKDHFLLHFIGISGFVIFLSGFAIHYIVAGPQASATLIATWKRYRSEKAHRRLMENYLDDMLFALGGPNMQNTGRSQPEIRYVLDTDRKTHPYSTGTMAVIAVRDMLARTIPSMPVMDVQAILVDMRSNTQNTSFMQKMHSVSEVLTRYINQGVIEERTKREFFRVIGETVKTCMQPA